jgi:hypothetical protein
MILLNRFYFINGDYRNFKSHSELLEDDRWLFFHLLIFLLPKSFGMCGKQLLGIIPIAGFNL